MCAADRPLTIDLHTHILPRTWPDLCERYGYEGFAALDHHRAGCARMIVGGKTFREIRDNCWSVERRIEECDQVGVNVQVLSTVPVMFNYWAKPDDAHDLCLLLNDHLAETVSACPSRFAALGTLPMQSADLAIRELERCVSQLGMPGVQIGTHVNGRNLNDPEIFRVLEAAAALNVGVFVHPWDMLGEDRMKDYWTPWLVGMPCETTLSIVSVILGGVLDRLPNLRICFAHGGGSFIGTLGRIEHGYHARPDLCAVDGASAPSQYLGRFYVDSLIHDPKMLAYTMDRIGADRIALGTDYPFPLGETHPGKLIRSMDHVDRLTTAQMLSGTALSFLGLDGARFRS